MAVIRHTDKRYVYYLVTKKSVYDKPTYGDLGSSLEAMREHMVCIDDLDLVIMSMSII